MFKRTKVSIGVLAAIGAAAAAVSPPVLAQERIEITGSRIPTVRLDGPSPVVVLSAKEIQLDGQTKAEELLNQMPSVIAAQTSAQSNGATGTAQVNLRNLGPTRNLVLVNGRRLPPGSPTQGGYAADVNQVPAALIKNVEILTGGASGVYGSDAMTGVVNFIMNDKFEGVQVNLGHSFYNHEQHNSVSGVVAAREATNPSAFKVPGDASSDGKVNNVTVLIGGNFAGGKGNATAYLDWKKEDPVLQAQRDFSACALNAAGADGSEFACGGSSTSFPGRFFLEHGTFTLDRETGNLRPFRTATDQYNFGPLNYYRRPSEKYGFGAFAHYDIAPEARVYTELGFHTDKTVAQIAPSGLFIFDASGANAIRFGNPLLTPQWVDLLAASNAEVGTTFSKDGDTANMLIGRRNVEGGGRQDDITHTSFRWVVGAKGTVFKSWNYDISMQTGRVELKRAYLNDFSNTRIGRALNVVSDANGNPVCQSVVDGTDPNCVPYNYYSLGGVTPAALSYLQVPGLANGSTQQQVRTFSLSADLGEYGIKVPMAKSGISVLFGAEQRKEKLALVTDNAFATGDLAGQGGATIGRSGEVKVKEFFTELRLPIIEKAAFADLLQASASYRYSDYSTNKRADSWGVGLEWAPAAAYRLRGSYQRAIRAANLEELFLAQGNNLFDIAAGDPCGPSKQATVEQCARSGLAPENYGAAILDSPAGQYNFLQGGNPDLNPEKANTYTLGLAVQPVRGLSASVDYWRIKMTDYISGPPALTILNECVFNSRFCDRVTRDRLGTLWALPSGRVNALQANLGGIETAGWDLAANYTQSLGTMGRVGVSFLGTLTSKWLFEPLKDLGKFDCAGLVGAQCGSPTPEWRHKLRGSWETPWKLDVALTWRHISKVKNETTSSDPILAAETAGIDRELGARNYLDLAASWRFNKTLSVTGGINNLTDRDPPIVSQTLAGPSINGNGNTFPGLYDTLGRYIFVNLQAKF